jgi:HNH endonuclease/Sel1 repeat
MSDSVPSYVTRPCENCAEGIEFDASRIEPEEKILITCPHCGKETTLSLETPSRKKAVPPLLSEHRDESFRPGDYPDAMKWVRKGAAIGDVESMALLGMYCLMNRNYEEAVNWLRRAADGGDTASQNNLGVCLYHGYGVEKNLTQAEELVRKAAETGNPEAQFHLGALYHAGHGVAKDDTQAFSWWLRAAEGGNPTAQNNVSIIYEEGGIVEQDLVESYKWMSLAAGQGYAEAEEHCLKIAAKMHVEQLAESRRRIEAIHSKTQKRIETAKSNIIVRLAEMGDAEALLFLDQGNKIMDKAIYVRQAISSDVRREVWRRDEGKCVKCGSRQKLEYDHIIPVSKGGSNTARNIELLCEACNRAKRASID